MSADLPQSNALSKQRLRLWLRLLRATRGIEAGLREALRDGFDTTLPRFDVMATLNRYPEGLRMSELSGKLMVSNGNVTGIIHRLETEGLVRRVRVESDRRATRVRLTPLGIQRFAELAAHHEAWVDGMLTAYDSEELETLIGLLSRVSERDKDDG
jgi:DNA-binding MarR family transcriptional regulator